MIAIIFDRFRPNSAYPMTELRFALLSARRTKYDRGISERLLSDFSTVVYRAFALAIAAVSQRADISVKFRLPYDNAEIPPDLASDRQTSARSCLTADECGIVDALPCKRLSPVVERTIFILSARSPASAYFPRPRRRYRPRKSNIPTPSTAYRYGSGSL